MFLLMPFYMFTINGDRLPLIINWDEKCLAKLSNVNVSGLANLIKYSSDKTVHLSENERQSVTKLESLKNLWFNKNEKEGRQLSSFKSEFDDIVIQLRQNRFLKNNQRKVASVDSAGPNRDSILGQAVAISTYFKTGKVMSRLNEKDVPTYLNMLVNDIIPPSDFDVVLESLILLVPCIVSADRSKERHFQKSASLNPRIEKYLAEHMPKDWINEMGHFNDPFAKHQWWLGGEDVGQGWVEAWNILKDKTLNKINIAVVDSECAQHDTSIRFTSNERECSGLNSVDDDRDGLIDNCHGWNFAFDTNDTYMNNDPGFQYSFMHGTAISSLIASNSNDHIGILGACSSCSVVCLKVGSPNGLDSSNLLKAYDWLLSQNIKISNHSYGGPGWIQAEYEALKKLDDSGHIMIMAAGNYGCNYDKDSNCDPFVGPAMYPLKNHIVVGASTIKGTRWDRSNYGMKIVHVYAPGSNIVAPADYSGRFTFWSGTSFAAPLVTSMVGSVMSIRQDLEPSFYRVAIVKTAKISKIKENEGWAGIASMPEFLRYALNVTSTTTTKFIRTNTTPSLNFARINHSSRLSPYFITCLSFL